MQNDDEQSVIHSQDKKYIHKIFFQRLFPLQRVAPCFLSPRFFSAQRAFTFFFLLSCIFMSMIIHLTNSEALAKEEIVAKTNTQTPKIDSNAPPLNVQKKNEQAPNGQAIAKSDKNGNEKKSAQDLQTKQNTEPTKNINPASDLQSSAYVNPTGIDGFGWKKYFQAVGTMLFLLLVLWYVLKIIRKYGNGRFLPTQKLLPKDAMYIEGQLSLGPHKCITIIKVLDKRLVLGITEKNITLLTEMVNNEELKLPKSFHEHIHDATTSDSAPASASDSSRTSTL